MPVTSALPEAQRALSGWGRTAVELNRVVRPRTAGELSGAVSGGASDAIIARGCGRSYGDAAQSRDGLVIDMTALRDVIAFDSTSGELHVQAGATVRELLALTLPRGWMLPVVPGTQEVTLGGAVASDIHGKNHEHDGTIARHILSFTLHTPGAGTLEVDRDHDREIFSATVGGMGLTGVLENVSLQLLSVSSPTMLVDNDRTSDLEQTLAVLDGGRERYRYSVAWIDALAGGRGHGRGVVIRANHASADSLAASDERSAPSGARATRVTVPERFPAALLRSATVRAFNELHWRLAPKHGRGKPTGVEPYFFPLDVVGEWNRLYGDGGLLQYQIVVPPGQEQVLSTVLERLRQRHVPVYLAVLKRFGPGSEGMLSFPIDGWTLALDLPAATPAVGETLDELDELVAGAGGRVYLAKDARLSAGHLAMMYPELERWRAVRARLDPAGAMRSDLADRLALTNPRASA
ncbi:MAG: FAD-binding protein [Solirubrobacteraceae bacterium]|nr:MAG: decaprenylphosphoryl-beta-D-ribose oxidase [Solirubrobacterales bacterium]